jgi:hypothetical protein
VSVNWIYLNAINMNMNRNMNMMMMRVMRTMTGNMIGELKI